MNMNKALIIVDEQNDFVEGGSLGVDGGLEVVNKTINFLKEHKNDYDLIVVTQDWHIDPGEHFSENPDYIDSWPVHCVAETEGAELVSELTETLENLDPVFIRKGQYIAAYSGFEGTDENGNNLETVLLDNSIGEVDIVGIAEDYCVNSTAIDANKLGFNTNVILDLTEAINSDNAELLRVELKNAGINLK